MPRYGFGRALADPWETLWRVLRQGGYYRTGKAKVAGAETSAPHLAAERNTSASFRYFCQGLELLGEPARVAASKRHVAA